VSNETKGKLKSDFDTIENALASIKELSARKINKTAESSVNLEATITSISNQGVVMITFD
jgi:hypothetical protein